MWKTASKFRQLYTKKALKFSKINFYLIDNKSMRIFSGWQSHAGQWKKLKAVFQCCS